MAIYFQRRGLGAFSGVARCLLGVTIVALLLQFIAPGGIKEYQGIKVKAKESQLGSWISLSLCACASGKNSQLQCLANKI